MTEKHYYRPHFGQLMDSIETYDDYIEQQLKNAETTIESEAVK